MQYVLMLHAPHTNAKTDILAQQQLLAMILMSAMELQLNVLPIQFVRTHPDRTHVTATRDMRRIKLATA